MTIYMHPDLLLIGPPFIIIGVLIIVFRETVWESLYDQRDRNRGLIGLGPVKRISSKWAIPPGVGAVVIGTVFTIVGIVSVSS